VDKYSDFGSHTSPRAGLILHPTSHSAIKLLYGHAFRASSGLEQGGLANVLVPAGDTLDPEIVDSYEVSYLVEHQRLSYELTGFYSKMKDNVNVLPNTGPAPEPFLYSNALKAKSKGIEIDTSWKPTEHLRLTLSGSSIESSSDDPDEYRAFPKNIVHWGINYFFIDNRANISVYNTHFLDMVSSDGRSTSLPSYWNTDLNVQYRLENRALEPLLSLSIGNLFNRSGISSVASTTENGQPQTPFHINLGIRLSI